MRGRLQLTSVLKNYQKSIDFTNKRKIIKPSYPTFNKDRKYYTPTFYIP